MSLNGPRQLSLFGVEAAEPGPADLAGLLAGPGLVERMGGTARISVAVDAAWRVHVLAAELTRRGLASSWEVAGAGRLVVRTAYTMALARLGAGWLRGAPGAGKVPPEKFYLDGLRLRLWAAAAGTPDPGGYLLRLGVAERGCWERVGAALTAIGLRPVLLALPAPGDAGIDNIDNRIESVNLDVPGEDGPGERGPGEDGPDESGPGERGPGERGPGEDGPDESGPGERGPGEAVELAFRITGRRRLIRLAELVGARPVAAPPAAWPGSD